MFTNLLVSVLIIAVCLGLHVTGILLLAHWCINRREGIQQTASWIWVVWILVVVFLCIMLMHIAETIIWAVFYYTRGLFSDFETAIYFSMTTYTTIGYGDLLLPRAWRLLGVMEGISGVLLCGLSTAFIFSVVNVMFQLRLAQTGNRTLKNRER